MAIQYIADACEMSRYDAYTTDNLGIPALVLMERAALSVVSSLKEHFPDFKQKKTLIICGAGNNGGDGMAIARLMLDMHCSVDVVLLAKEEKCSISAKKQLDILKNYNLSQNDFGLFINIKDIHPILKNNEYDIIIDGIFGVGLSRPVEGDLFECINAINEYRAFVVSLDLPSGIDCGNGSILGCAVKADLTVTFAYAKRGLYLYPGKKYAGEIDIRDIGITEKSFNTGRPSAFTFPKMLYSDKTKALKELSKMLPVRNEEGNKGTFGKLLIIAGKEDMCGACIMCAESAYRMGAGLVKIVTPKVNRNIIQTVLPEAMLLTYDPMDINKQSIVDAVKWADGVVIGPGMGQSESTADIFEMVLKEAEGILVIDADAINILAVRKSLQDMLMKRKQRFKNSCAVLTPHQGELARLMGKPVNELKANPVTYAKELAVRLKCIVVNKDAVTVVCDEGPEVYINNSGNCGMATAGSGDVLSGILGGMLVMKQEVCNSMLISVACAVYIHGCAGDLARERVGEHGMIAGDIIESLKEISKEGQ